MVLIRVSIVRRKAIIMDFTKAKEIIRNMRGVVEHNVIAIERGSKVADR